VVRQRVHAFRNRPKGMVEDQPVLLSKNRSRSSWYERQVQHVARIRAIRPASPEELDRLYPGVNAGQRWNYVVELYAVTPLARQLDLHQVHGLDDKRFQTVQTFAEFTEEESGAIGSYLIAREPGVVCALLNSDPAEEGQATA
jgi:hypothetical protein